MVSNAIVPGSLSAIAQQNHTSLSESFLSADCILLLDESGSMTTTDTVSGESRREVARKEVIRLQKDFPGRIALIAFSSTVVFCPAGVPVTLDAGTDLYRALEYIKIADGTGMKFIIVSDGVPSRPEDCISLARQFETKFDCVYIGPEQDYEGGRAFLKRLAETTGGQSLKSDAPGLLAQPVETLLLRG